MLAIAGWHHREKVTRSNFDPWARNPSYTNVDGEKAWELVSMANHFHPSVSMFAKNVIAGNDDVNDLIYLLRIMLHLLRNIRVTR